MYVSAAQYSAQYYQRSLRLRAMIRRDFDRAFDRSGKHRLDAILTPTTPTTAFPIEAVYGDSVLMQYADQLAVPANHAGVPAMSMPGGLDKDGLPIGVQLVGPDFSEALLLRLGRAFELASSDEDWRKEVPVVLRK
jgi:aspartyl-tRNA(Asn)/glutamyl-tRNA(Gln) amidotransferase subunit A